MTSGSSGSGRGGDGEEVGLLDSHLHLSFEMFHQSPFHTYVGDGGEKWSRKCF